MDDIFEPFVLSIIFIFVLLYFCKFAKQYSLEVDEKERKERAEYEKWMNMPYDPSMPWKYRRRRHDIKRISCIIPSDFLGEKYVWRSNSETQYNIREITRKRFLENLKKEKF